MTRMHVDLRCGETLTIGEARVRLERKSGQVARLVIEADRSIPIHTTARKSVSQAKEPPNGQHALR